MNIITPFSGGTHSNKLGIQWNTFVKDTHNILRYLCMYSNIFICYQYFLAAVVHA